MCVETFFEKDRERERLSEGERKEGQGKDAVRKQKRKTDGFDWLEACVSVTVGDRILSDWPREWNKTGISFQLLLTEMPCSCAHYQRAPHNSLRPSHKSGHCCFE